MAALTRLLLLALLVVLALPAIARDETEAPHVFLMDARTGETLFEKNADKAFAPASLSKIMTVLVAAEALGQGKLTLSTPIHISVNAWRKGGGPSGGAAMFADVNSDVPLSAILRGIIVDGGNDAAIALAEHLSGSEAAFAQSLQARAKALGLVHSQFRNATGFAAPGHVATARELALLSEYLIRRFPGIARIFAEPEFTWNNIRQPNRNRLIKEYPGADGMVTGYAPGLGYHLIATAERGGRRLILVIAGAKSPAARSAEAKRFLDMGFARFKPVAVFHAGEHVGRARVWGGASAQADLVTRQDVKVMLSDSERGQVKAELVYQGPLRAPVPAGEPVGMVRIMVGGAVISQTPAFVAQRVDETPEMWRKALDRLLILAFGS